jgi:hypothetical protein
MSSIAIRLIVDGYLTLKDRTSLEELREHRQRLRRQLDGQGGPFDVRFDDKDFRRRHSSD